MPRSKISDAAEINSFAASFMHLKLRRERKITWKWEKAGHTGLQDVKVMCFLEGGYGLSQKYFHLDA